MRTFCSPSVRLFRGARGRPRPGIVRRKPRGQRLESRQRYIKDMIRRVLIGGLLTVAVISLAAASWLWRSTGSHSTAGPRPVSAANDAPPLPGSELDASPAPGPPKRKRATKAVEAEEIGRAHV